MFGQNIIKNNLYFENINIKGKNQKKAMQILNKMATSKTKDDFEKNLNALDNLECMNGDF